MFSLTNTVCRYFLKRKNERNFQFQHVRAYKVKEQDIFPSNQTKEEEIGNLPDKKSQVMIVKMIQNLENKMELQINSLDMEATYMSISR